MALKCGICDPVGLMLYFLFLLRNACCHVNSDVLKSTVMDRAYNCINYMYLLERKLAEMLIGKQTVIWWLACLVIVQ